MIEQIQRVIPNIIERVGTQGAAKESLGTVPASLGGKMILRKIARGIIVLAAILCICGLLVWVVVPYIFIGWDCLFPHYDHRVALLSSDIECQVSGEGSELQSITLPKGLMLYAPCRHDFDRMSLDENCIYKIYLKLDAKTAKSLLKDSDISFGGKLRGVRRYGDLEEKH